MAEAGYNQFCPVAMAAEVLCTRWTVIVLRELMAGSTRFNALRRGLPRMSPALLSKRLKDLEAAGVVKRSKAAGEPGAYDYTLTPAGKELKPVVEAIGVWGHRWVQTESSLDNLDPNLLMWDMRRNISVDPMPLRRSTIQVILSDQPDSKRNWWLIVQPGQDNDLC
jgi:DNA-binding HxlR family transcriptional regulator